MKPAQDAYDKHDRAPSELWFRLPINVVAIVLCATSTPVLANDGNVDYQLHIKPLLAARCIACHGVLKQEAGLRLDTGLLLKEGGSSGAVIQVGDAASSAIIQRTSSSNPEERMPPEGEPLTAQQLEQLTQWINSGAISPEDELPEPDPREHWSFKKIERPTAPATNMKWGSNPIDAFIAAGLEQHNLQPQHPATRHELIRRVYLDVLGVPPSLEELEQLSSDTDDGWYQRLVDRLLEDTRYGQRWGRHWMDIWRYSDWWGLGDQLRNSQMHIWHWRDWIVESLNSDLPYDEMIRQMIAGDELYPTDQNRLRATGYLARNYFLFNRHQWMDETVEHVGKGLLGLTLNCAKCHDHKYDPVNQTDYYRLRAFFEPYHVRLDMLPGEVDLNRNGLPRVFESQQDAPTYRFIRGQENQPDKSAVIAPGLPDILAFDDLKIEALVLPSQAWQPERQGFVQEAYIAAADQRISAAQTSLGAALEQLSQANTQAPEKQAAAIAEATARLRVAEAELAVATEDKASTLMRLSAMRADWSLADAAAEVDKKPLQEAAKSANNLAIVSQRKLDVAKARAKLASAEQSLLKAAADKRAAVEKEVAAAREALTKSETLAAAEIKEDEKFQPLVGGRWTATRFFNSGADDPAISFGPKSSGRRTALARWLTDRRNPLTARVAANHIWMRHTGSSLVSNVFDLGRKSPAPTHQELLDWLASELIESGWSMKHLHRLILNSDAYRMSSSTLGMTDNLTRDPDNQWLWRRNAIRMESQVVRDSLLALSGSLDLTAGGPPIMPNDQAASKRRSLYFFHSNNERNLFLTTFDEAAVKDCYRREQSIVPQQALALTNSQLVLDSAAPIAEQLLKHLGSAEQVEDTAFVKQAFVYVLGIEPGIQELQRCQESLTKWREAAIPVNAQDAKSQSQQAQAAARSMLVWALLNHTDFVTVR